jgi:hypothetical protein
MLKTRYDNIHSIDRIARLALGAVMVTFIFNPTFDAYWVALASVYPIMTAIMAWDPIYAWFESMKRHSPAKSKAFTHAPA